MLNRWKRWSDKWLQIHPDPGGDSVNGVQFASEAIILLYLSRRSNVHTLRLWFNKLISSVSERSKNGITTKQTPTTTFEKDPGSHDNETLLRLASYLLGLNDHKDLVVFGRFWHPRDIIFYLNLKTKWARPFLWLLIPIHMFTCARLWKRQGYPETSTKILAYFRMISRWDWWEMRVSYKICTRLISRNKDVESKHYGRRVDLSSWHENFRYYFKYQDDHPVVETHVMFEDLWLRK